MTKHGILNPHRGPTGREVSNMFDEEIRDIEARYEVLSSAVSDSRLHEIINNPVDEGIDEG